MPEVVSVALVLYKYLLWRFLPLLCSTFNFFSWCHLISRVIIYEYWGQIQVNMHPPSHGS